MIKVTLPLSTKDIETLRCGDELLLSGTVYMARDLAHQKIVEMIIANEALPINLENAVIYYAGPTACKPGNIIGSAGPTTSSRMDKYMDVIMASGSVISIGKGPRSEEYQKLVHKHRGLYLTTIGGVGALLSKCIKKCQVVAFENFGPEALYEIELSDFYAVVTYDAFGNDLYKTNK